MEYGTVRWFSDQKGFGFISPADGGDDLFAHFSTFHGGLETLKIGQKVLFSTAQAHRGRQAMKIRLA